MRTAALLVISLLGVSCGPATTSATPNGVCAARQATGGSCQTAAECVYGASNGGVCGGCVQ